MTNGGPLSGFRIIEFAGLGPGPMAGQLLGDLGAEIVVIDRASGPADPTDINRRNKTSAALNLKSPEGIEVALRLIESADALIEGFRPGVMEKLGLGPEVCMARNPGLVYTRVTGWGQEGPLAHTAGHDMNYMSLSGAFAAMGYDDRAPMPPLNIVADYAAGSMFAIMGLLAALLERQGSGQGQVIDAAMCDGVPALLSIFHMFRARGDWTLRREDNMLDGGAPFYRSYETRDGRYLSVGPIELQFFAEFQRLAGLGDLPKGAPYDKATWPALRETIAARIAERTMAEWMEVFDGSDACVAPVLTFEEAEDHPHNRARDIHLRNDDVLQAAPAPRFSRTAPTRPATPGAPGAGTDALLSALGYSDQDIGAMRGAGILT